MRAQAQGYNKNRRLSSADFSEFEKNFGDDPFGKSKRIDGGSSGRFRYFSREEISARNDDLNISWLSSPDQDPESLLTEPDDLALAALGHLRSALLQLEAVIEEPGFGEARR